jgi:hypothetical protein
VGCDDLLARRRREDTAAGEISQALEVEDLARPVRLVITRKNTKLLENQLSTMKQWPDFKAMVTCQLAFTKLRSLK